MTLDINFGAGWWRFQFVPVGTQISTYDLTFNVDAPTLRSDQTACMQEVESWVMPRPWPSQTTTVMVSGAAPCHCNEGTSGNYIFLNSPNDGGDWEPKRTSTVSSALTLPTTTTVFGAVDGNRHFHVLWSVLYAALARQVRMYLRRDVPSGHDELATVDVNLNGNFNGWCGGCAEMTDADGDGVR